MDQASTPPQNNVYFNQNDQLRSQTPYYEDYNHSRVSTLENPVEQQSIQDNQCITLLGGMTFQLLKEEGLPHHPQNALEVYGDLNNELCLMSRNTFETLKSLIKASCEPEVNPTLKNFFVLTRTRMLQRSLKFKRKKQSSPQSPRRNLKSN